MPSGLSIALALLAQAASTPPAEPVYGPAAPVTKPPVPTPPKTAERDCAPQSPAASDREIIVCAVKPNGYRIDPALVEARREKKQGDAGRPHNPHESYAVHDCATIGPMGCRGGQTFNVLAAAATAVEIANRLAKGQEIGSLFVVDPHQSEYQLYQQARKRNEFIDAEKAIKLESDNAPAIAP
ncbi:MAG TPA: hypothetical protein VF098_11670 [Sphingomicrobium sp.]|jgi:hypothetical protein